MKRSLLVLSVLLLATAHPAWSGEPCCDGGKPTSAANDPAGVALERLKKLVGDWGVANASEGDKGKVMSRYRLTGGGTAVVETIFPDSPMEMLSIYHRDGDQLLMTHYCALGNQPRMRARLGADKDEIAFDFVGGDNLDPAKDKHVHDGRIRFVGADRIQSEWQVYVDGKPAGKHAFELVRKKS